MTIFFKVFNVISNIFLPFKEDEPTGLPIIPDLLISSVFHARLIYLNLILVQENT